MKTKSIYAKSLRASYEQIEHDSGLTLLLYPMENTSSVAAWMTTRYGSLHNVFRTDARKPYTHVPEGIAHFLEHKLFEDEEGDAFVRFAKTGGDANAFTSYGQTTYLVECVDDFKDNLEVLLKMVTTPYFTEKAVKKEQGIIGQEIAMYQDDPDWRVEFNLMQALYHNHPARIDIAGTAETIEKITPKLLFECYETFYALSNMVLVVTGDFSRETVLAVCDGVLTSSPQKPIDMEPFHEPESIVRDFVSEKKAVALPIFAIGYKNPVIPEKAYVKTMASHIILQELLVGESSGLYQQMYEDGLITSPVQAYGFDEKGAFASVFSGEAKEPT